MPTKLAIVKMYTTGWLTKNVPVTGVHQRPSSSAGRP